MPSAPTQDFPWHLSGWKCATFPLLNPSLAREWGPLSHTPHACSPCASFPEHIRDRHMGICSCCFLAGNALPEFSIWKSHISKPPPKALFDLQAGLRSPLGSQFSGTQPDVVYFSGLGGDRASSCSPLCTRVPEFDENSRGGEASSSCRSIFVSATALQIGHGRGLQNGASSQPRHDQHSQLAG